MAVERSQVMGCQPWKIETECSSHLCSNRVADGPRDDWKTATLFLRFIVVPGIAGM